MEAAEFRFAFGDYYTQLARHAKAKARYTATMLVQYEHRGVVWIDLESPTSEEVKRVAESVGIEPLVAEELLLPSARPRIESYGHYIYIIMHFPALRHSHASSVEQEIDFIVGKDFLITTHYDVIDPLHKFSKIFETNSLLDKSTIGDNAGYLLFYMLKNIYKSIEHEIEYVHRDLNRIEKQIFDGHEVEMVPAISQSARDLLNLRQTIEPHREILKTFEVESVRFFGDEYVPYARALANEYYRVHNHISRHIETVHELRETNNSLLTTKQNETMRVLTIMALLTFPLALMVSILQIDTVHNPVRGLPYDFWIILGSVIFVGLCMILYFKHKKWL